MTDEQKPEPIVFRRNAEGELTARIDNLQVGFFEDDGGFIVVWGTETFSPCTYEGYGCTVETGRTWRECPVRKACPCQVTETVQEDSTVFSNEGDRDEVAARIRRLFRRASDGFGHRQKWPQPAASQFAKAPWVFEQ